MGTTTWSRRSTRGNPPAAIFRVKSGRFKLKLGLRGDQSRPAPPDDMSLAQRDKPVGRKRAPKRPAPSAPDRAAKCTSADPGGSADPAAPVQPRDNRFGSRPSANQTKRRRFELHSNARCAQDRPIAPAASSPARFARNAGARRSPTRPMEWSWRARPQRSRSERWRRDRTPPHAAQPRSTASLVDTPIGPASAALPTLDRLARPGRGNPSRSAPR